MVEEGNLPRLVRVLQLLLEPGHLRRIHVRAFEGEELHVLFRLDRVIQLPVHVEQLVVTLFAGVVIPERGVELHSGLEQWRVRHLELLLEILGPFRPVQVVADHRHQLVGEAVVYPLHLRGEIVLFLAASAEVSEHGELQRIVPVRERQRKRRRTSRLGLCGAGRSSRERKEREDESRSSCGDARQHIEARDYRGRTFSIRSTTRWACSSIRMRCRPMNRNSSSSGSGGSPCSTWGGTVESGTVSG